MPPSPTAESRAERSFVDADGVTIFYDVYPAVGTARGVVQIAHGVGEHAGRFRVLAETLARAGFAVYADDHRGHGRTGMAQHGGDARKLGRLGVGGHRAAVAAVWQFTELIRAENPDLPLVLFGHSWGSFLAQILLNDHPEAYDAVALSGSALRWPGSLNAGNLNARFKTEGTTGAEWLATDPAVADAFVADPLTTLTPLLRLFGPIDAVRLFGRPRKALGRDIPILLMVGRDDPVGGPRSVHRLADAYRSRSGLTDVTTLVYPAARHEIFNEVMQEEVRADLLAWLDAHIPARD
jgi:alpha-beta hydrolase superfamily lysophospholipase